MRVLGLFIFIGATIALAVALAGPVAGWCVAGIWVGAWMMN